MDHESVRRMLAWVAYARRPLLFGKIDLILSLPSRRPNFLLWGSLRGRFASIFHLKFPRGYDPVEDDNPDAPPTQSDLDDGDQSTQGEDDPPIFGFTGDDDEDEGGDDEIQSIDTKVLSAQANRGLESLAIDSSSNESDKSLHIFSDGQMKTVVTFSHQRIRDYLVREGSAKTRRKAPMDIYPNIHRVQLDITATCLDILRLGLALQGDTRYLVDYPAKNFVWHLERIDMNSVEHEDKKQILRGLHWLFHESAGVKSLLVAAGDSEDDGYDLFWRTWLSSNAHTRSIQAWFGQIGTLASGFDDEVDAWMKSASTSVKELLRPLAMSAAAQWLTKPGYDSTAYLDKTEFLVWVLQGYLGLDDDGVLSDELCSWAWYKCAFEDIPLEQLQRLAEWAQLEKTSHWHTGLAWIMMEGCYYEQAISHFNEALKQDSDAWVAKEGLARCLGEQEMYDETIEWQDKAIASLPSNLSFLAAYLYPHIALWKGAKGDDEGAFEAAQRAYNADLGSALAQLRYLEALDATDSFEAIIDVLKELDEWGALERDYSYLVRFLVLGYDAYDQIGRACRARGKPEFVLAAIDKAMTLIDQSDNERMQLWLPAQVATFRYDYYDQVEQPVELWEAAIKRIDAGDSTTQKTYAKMRRIYSNNLAQLYFDAAVAAQEATSDPTPYTMKLKALSVVTETSPDDDDAFDFYGTGYASMLWGRWLRDYQDAEESVWRKCFRARALEEMDMLDDNDPSNDTRGLHTLAITLLQSGDRTNAGAILAILFKPLEDLSIREVIENDKIGQSIGKNNDFDEHNEGAGDAKEQYQASNQPDPPVSSTTEDSEADISPGRSVLKTDAPPLEAGNVGSPSPQVPQVTKTVTMVGPTNRADSKPPAPSAPVTEPTSSQPKLQLGNSWVYTCDGCSRDTQDAGEMYFYEICLDKNYC